MNIGEVADTSKVAVMHFSHIPIVDGLFGAYATTFEFQATVSKLPFIGKQTRIDRALSKASNKVFKAISISRPNIAIFFTDGVQTKDSFWEIPKALETPPNP